MTAENPAFGFDHDRLADYLEQQHPNLEGPATATKFAAGQSNPTFQIEAASCKHDLRCKLPGGAARSAWLLQSLWVDVPMTRSAFAQICGYFGGKPDNS